jgi:hypothetical protein
MTEFQIACLIQLIEGSCHAIGFISDGSSSKVIESATVRGVSVSNRGISISVIDSQTGKTRSVSWRMSNADSVAIVAAYADCEIDSVEFAGDATFTHQDDSKVIKAYYVANQSAVFLAFIPDAMGV